MYGVARVVMGVEKRLGEAIGERRRERRWAEGYCMFEVLSGQLNIVKTSHVDGAE
jgi:hypothetical protein